MRRWRAALLLAAFSAAAPALAAGPAGDDAPPRARALYERHCGVCHGEGQTGTVILARRLGAQQALLAARTDLAAPYVRQVVRAGLVNMPRMTRVELPDADLDAITAWLARPR